MPLGQACVSSPCRGLGAILGANRVNNVSPKTDTFLGERYRRIARGREKLKALVATARSILIIVWHLLADRAARYCDLGPAWYAGRIDKDRKIRAHIRQLKALGYTVSLAPAA
jgi:transposase